MIYFPSKQYLPINYTSIKKKKSDAKKKSPFSQMNTGFCNLRIFNGYALLDLLQKIFIRWTSTIRRIKTHGLTFSPGRTY